MSSIDWCKWITCIGVLVAVILASMILSKVDKKHEGFHSTKGNDIEYVIYNAADPHNLWKGGRVVTNKFTFSGHRDPYTATTTYHGVPTKISLTEGNMKNSTIILVMDGHKESYPVTWNGSNAVFIVNNIDGPQTMVLTSWAWYKLTFGLSKLCH